MPRDQCLGHFVVELHYKNHADAYHASFFPGVTDRIAHGGFQAMITLGAAVLSRLYRLGGVI